MIFAPRSCPSRPGFAITTRIVPGTWAEYRGAPDRHRLLAGMAESRKRTFRLHAPGRREPRVARLRPGRPRAPTRDGRSGRRGRDRDHALAPRPLGRSRAVGLGHVLPRVERPIPKPALWVQPGGASTSRPSANDSASPTCSSGRSTSTSTSQTRRSRSGSSTITPTRVPHYTLETYAFRVQSNGAVLAYSGDSAPSEELVESARDADLFVCEATLLRGELDGEPRGHLSLDEAVEAYEASGAKRLLVTHRPRELPDSRRVRARLRRSRARRLARGSRLKKPTWGADTLGDVISVVVPLLNEERSLEALYAEIAAALEPRSDEFGVVFVDDGSTDGSMVVLPRLHDEMRTSSSCTCAGTSERPPRFRPASSRRAATSS